MRHFFAHVAGESFRNDDGSDRQAIIASCRVGEPLVLESQPDNPYDSNAIRVLREDGKQIGHLERGLAARFTGEGFDDCRAFVAGAGRAGGGYYGVALLIVVAQERDEEPEVSAYAKRVLEQEGNLAAGAPRRRRPRESVEGPAASSIMRPIIIGAIVAAGFIAAVAMFATP